MLANRQDDFRCTLADVDIINEKQVVISKDTAKALRVKAGETIRVIPF